MQSVLQYVGMNLLGQLQGPEVGRNFEEEREGVLPQGNGRALHSGEEGEGIV